MPVTELLPSPLLPIAHCQAPVLLLSLAAHVWSPPLLVKENEPNLLLPPAVPVAYQLPWLSVPMSTVRAVPFAVVVLVATHCQLPQRFRLAMIAPEVVLSEWDRVYGPKEASVIVPPHVSSRPLGATATLGDSPPK